MDGVLRIEFANVSKGSATDSEGRMPHIDIGRDLVSGAMAQKKLSDRREVWPDT